MARLPAHQHQTVAPQHEVEDGDDRRPVEDAHVPEQLLLERERHVACVREHEREAQHLLPLVERVANEGVREGDVQEMVDHADQKRQPQPSEHRTAELPLERHDDDAGRDDVQDEIRQASHGLRVEDPELVAQKSQRDQDEKHGHLVADDKEALEHR